MSEQRSTSGLRARRATLADIPLLVELMREFYAEAGHTLDPRRAVKGFSTLLGDPRLGAAWLLYDDSVPAGFVTLTLRFSMEYFGIDGFVDDLFVKPEHRRRGLGRRALRTVVAECGRLGIAALHVVVGADNAVAKPLYNSFGLVGPTDGREILSVRLDIAS